ncbi:MAG: GNAT family N-acetyltransferase [Alphaproteobacteria bacterium]|jgi:GNAT superfamily N-acetyltransferase|nr:GNAT family N-acetyltransferase [Alphaproteobacteria bacterium]
MTDTFSTRLSGSDTVIITNRNTTIGYATFDASAGLITYIFVNPGFRKSGFGSMLVEAAQQAAGKVLRPAEPVSPLGQRFFERFGKA